MMLSNVEQAWADAQQSEQNCYAIVEVGLLSASARLQLLQTECLKQSLMQQEEFAALRAHGPWLLDIGHLEFSKFLAMEGLIGTPALMGWIRTDCSFTDLAEHLSDALLAKDDADSVYLLRSYTPTTLPILYARRAAPWHAWLFGPMHDWWFPSADADWQCLSGLSLERPGDYQPIHLDADLWQALELDPLAFSLTSELEKSAAEVFTSECHGDRLAQVTGAVDAGRREGLQQPADLSLFATLQLFDHHFPANHPNWAQVLTQVQEQQQPLARVLKRLSA